MPYPIGRVTTGMDEDGVIMDSQVRRFGLANSQHIGAVVNTHPLLETEPSTNFFVNETFGVAMNQVIAFGGVGLRATVIHAGVNSGSADSGTTTATSPFRLRDSTQDFNSTVGPGALVHNTTDDTYALVTTVNGDTLLLLDTDIMTSGEDYVINNIWPGTAVQGTWNFEDSGKFTITNGSNNDEATFTVDSAHIWNMTHFVSFTGKVDLDTYDGSSNTITLEFGLDGALVGNTVNIDDFINTGDFSEQSFVIPKANFGLIDNNFNSMRITIGRTSGTKTDIKFDDFKWENTGTPIIYNLNITQDTRLHIEELVLTFTDELSIGLTDGTVPGLAHNQILGLSQLTNGFVVTRTKGGDVLFSATIRSIGAAMSAGAVADIPLSDGTNTIFVLRIKFLRNFILTGDPDDSLTIQINDDMSGLTQFTIAAVGGLET